MIKRSTSAGGVIFNDNRQILLVKQPENNWTFPKGHVNEDEDALTAAKREIFEEGGTEILHMVRFLGSYERSMLNPDGTEDPSQMKTLVMFLFHAGTHVPKPHDSDILEAIWLPEDQVAERLTHPRDREFFLSIKKEIP